MMKVIITDKGDLSLNQQVLDSLFQTRPDLFKAGTWTRKEIKEFGLDNIVVRNGQVYQLETDGELRTLPWLVEQLENDPDAVTWSYTQVVEIPDDIEWYIEESGSGFEYVSEAHRTWGWRV